MVGRFFFFTKMKNSLNTGAMHRRIAWINKYITLCDKKKENVPVSSETFSDIS